MAPATNTKAEAEPLTVEMGQLEKAAAALCVDTPLDAISVAAGDDKGAPAAGMAGDGDKGAPATREGLTRLPDEEVQRVLSWKRGKLTSIYSTPEAIEVFEALSDCCAEYQAWMRAEYEANGGVVWVDDEFLREQAESIQSLKDEVGDDDDDDFDFTGWHFEGDVDSPGWKLEHTATTLIRSEFLLG